MAESSWLASFPPQLVEHGHTWSQVTTLIKDLATCRTQKKELCIQSCAISISCSGLPLDVADLRGRADQVLAVRARHPLPVPRGQGGALLRRLLLLLRRRRHCRRQAQVHRPLRLQTGEGTFKGGLKYVETSWKAKCLIWGSTISCFIGIYCILDGPPACMQPVTNAAHQR